MNIPMTDLKIQYEHIKDEISSAVQEVMQETGFILGKQVGLCEEEVARYLGVKYAVGVASGTDALVLSLIALGIKKGDEVITTPFTFIATAEAISRVGARPVFCDIDSETYNIDPDQVEAKITSRTKALLPVHLYGLPCDMKKVVSIARAHKLKIIEDCAQSFGSEYEGVKVGAFGDCGCLSFFPAKTLGCYGDGGMVITNNQESAEKLKRLRNHGSSNKYFYSMHGFNSRLDTVQAAVVRVKLKYIDTWIEGRIRAALSYNELLQDVRGITVAKTAAHCKHSFNYYTVRVSGKRDALQNHLKEKGIATAVYYPLCLHLQELYKDIGYTQGDFPTAEEAQKEVLSLPMYPELSAEQVKIVADSIKDGI